MNKSTKALAILGAVAVSNGAMIAPLSSYAEGDVNQSDNDAVITVHINESLSMTVTGTGTTVSMANNAINESLEHSINVATNNPDGYVLTLVDKDEDNSLVGPTLSDATTIKIPAVSGTSLEATTPAWGYKVKEPGSSYGDNWSAVPVAGSPAIIRTQNGPVDNSSFNETTKVKFGFASGDVASGSYTDTITYTATGNIGS